MNKAWPPPSDEASDEYIRQLRRFFAFLKVSLASLLVLILVTMWWVRSDLVSTQQVAMASQDAAREAKRAAENNSFLLELYKPCLPEEDQSSAQCERARLVADAIAAIQAQHNEQDAKLAALLADVDAIKSRPPPAPRVAPQPRSTPTTARPAPRTTVGPRPAPAPTPTTTKPRGKAPAKPNEE